MNPSSGTANVHVGIPFTSGRSDFTPDLSLTYNSSFRNSVFGTGWELSGLPSISLSLKDGFPKYDGKDKFIFNGVELVPYLSNESGDWEPRIYESEEHWIHLYRSRKEQRYLRLEKWVHKNTKRVHWRLRDGKNVVSIFGKNDDGSTRIADPDDDEKIFRWLLEAQYDPYGNAIKYVYEKENTKNVAGNAIFEKQRKGKVFGFTQRYLKRIYYGNTLPLAPDEFEPGDNEWLFEVVFDYGEHEGESQPSYEPTQSWLSRPDPFSSYSSGFEIRTYRLCRRTLMFHHFPDELGEEATLIGNIEFFYNEYEAGTTLESIQYTGYRWNPESDTFQEKSVPPLIFDYTQPEPGNSFHPVQVSTSENVPAGIGDLNYKWIDLYGEGLPGILFESNQAWYYKRNLGGGRLGKQKRIAEKPSVNFGSYALSDFDVDGNMNLVVLKGREAGFYEYDRERERWSGYRSFSNAPQVERFTRLIDLTGDGRSDLVSVEQDRIIWYPSKGKEGFDAAEKISKPTSNGESELPTLGNNPSLNYYFADMTGDGLPDQVRITNGRVEYWPNLGRGRFGKSVVMGNAPGIEFDFEYDPGRVRLTDLTGSGTADLLYIGRGEIRYWVNANGNQFLEENTIGGLPTIDNISSVQIIDFLGNGTPCLVWSSGLTSHSDAPIHYLPLTSGIKPRLLLNIQNSMGKETKIHYGYSAEHYLRDKRNDRDWISRLPSHNTVVDRLEVIDHIGNTRLEQRFEYHDGFYDGENREFRGFGLVDQYDSERHRGSGIPESEFTDPVCVRTWFHNGMPGWERRRSQGYYSLDENAHTMAGHEVENLNQIDSDEYFKAFEALAGRVIRTEVYGLGSEEKKQQHPFQVSQNRFLLRRIQPEYQRFDPCVASFLRETLNYQYEENPDDPRIEHTVNLEVDEYGQSRSSIEIAYPRRTSSLEEQEQYHLHLAQQEVQHFDEEDRYELGVLLENKVYKLSGITPGEGASYFKVESLQSEIALALENEIPFYITFTGDRQSSLIQWSKIYYWSSGQTEALPWGDVGNPVLVHHTEEACFDEDFLENSLDAHYSPDLAGDEGFYENHDGYWWKPGSTFFYREQEAFYRLEREENINGGFSQYEFDAPYFVNLVSVTDPLDNKVSAEIDYHQLAPYRITDFNDNVSEVRYDPLGMIRLASSHGDILSSEGTVELYGHEPLDSYTEIAPGSFEDIIDNPDSFVQEAASFFHYDLDSWTREEGERTPLRSVALIREQWVHDGEGNRQPDSGIQVNINYLDGLGRSLQTKTLAESGDAIARNEEGDVITDRGEPVLQASDIRWKVSGHTVYNNKQEVVRQFEPFFSPDHEYESDEILEQFGYSSLTYYDALGREIQTDYPDGTLTRVEISPWQISQYDPNDTVVGSSYEMRVEAEATESDPAMTALEKAREDDDTPVISHLDPLGRAFMIEEVNGDGTVRRMRTVLDHTDNPVYIIDPMGLESFNYSRDMLGRIFYEDSMDAGEKWQFIDALDRPVHQWDGRGVHQQLSYDLLGRITRVDADGALGMDHVTERYRYGEAPDISDARLNNLRGKMAEQYDSAGVLRINRCDLTGQVLQRSRQLTADYENIPDWTTVDDVPLQDEVYLTRIHYDALARTMEEILPEGTTRRYRYNQSGVIEQVEVSTADGTVSEQPVLREAIYNAKDQRTRVTLGNGVTQTFQYDDRTNRLSRLTAHRPAGGDMEEGRQYQNIRYTYDPVGNITHLIDTARPNGASILAEPRSCSYTYDSFYQLVLAEGRTHQALEANDYNHDPETEGFRQGTRHIGLNNAEVIRDYTREYSYDLGGNLESMIHTTNIDTGVNRWRRDYWISGRSNRSLPAEEMSGVPISDPESRFDGNGNTLYLPHLSEIEWDYRNQLSRAVIVEREGQPDDVEYYAYGADNQRVRKVHQRVTDVAAGTTETTEKIYLDGCEIKRVRSGDTELLERYTVHLTDGDQRLGLMHRWTRDDLNLETDDPDAVQYHYQLTDHLGSATMELNGQGEIINYEEYFPYGDSAFVAGSSVDVNLKEYRYSGKEQDATRLYYFGYRYYAPWIGNWLNPDPIGPEDSLNLYQYVRNNPVNLGDLNGLITFFTTQFSYPNEWNEDTQENRRFVAQHVLEIYGFQVEQLVWDEEFRRRNEEGEVVQRGRWRFQGHFVDLESFGSLEMQSAPQINENALGTIPSGELNTLSTDELEEPDISLSSREEERQTRMGTSEAQNSEVESGSEEENASSRTDDSNTNGSGDNGTNPQENVNNSEDDTHGLGITGRGTGGGGSSDERGSGVGQGEGSGPGIGRGHNSVERGESNSSSVDLPNVLNVNSENENEYIGHNTLNRPSGNAENQTVEHGIQGGGEHGIIPPEGVSPPIDTELGTSSEVIQPGSNTGMNESSGQGGLTQGSNSTGSKMGTHEGNEQGSLLSGGEGGTKEPDTMDDIVSAMGVANLDFIGYDSDDPNATESGIPAGVLGWLDFGEHINQSLYISGTILGWVLGGIGMFSRRVQQASSAASEGTRQFFRRYLPHVDRLFGFFEKLFTSPSTRHLMDEVSEIPGLLEDFSLPQVLGRRWRRGDPHDAIAEVGQELSWDTIRSRYWKNVYEDSELTDIIFREFGIDKLDDQLSNLARMQRGSAPLDPITGLPIELEHIVPQRTGAAYRHRHVLPVSQLEHAFFDRFRIASDPSGTRWRLTTFADRR